MAKRWTIRGEFEVNNHDVDSISPSERIIYLDSVKGLAILLVVLGHIVKKYVNYGYFQDAIFQMTLVISIIYSFHMPLLMIISGMLFKCSYLKNGIVARTRIKRHGMDLLVVYIAFCVLIGIGKIAFNNFVVKKITFLDIALILIKPISTYWYLYVLFVFYVAFCIISLKKVDMRIALSVALILSLLSSFITTIEYFSLYNVARYAFFFCIGMVVSEGALFRCYKHFLWMLAGVVVLIGSYYWYHGVATEHVFGVQAIVGVGVSFGVLSVFYNHRIGSSKLLALLGRYSLDIYVLHQLIYIFVLKVSFMLINDNWILSAIVSTLICIGVVGIITCLMNLLKIRDPIFKPYSFICKLSKKYSNG